MNLYIKSWQRIIAVKVDGLFGPKTLSRSAEVYDLAFPHGQPTFDPLGATSLRRLEGVHADLEKVVTLAAKLSARPFVVVEGVRTMERQEALFKRGATTTMNSRHLTGHAVDIAPYIDGEVSWHWPDYHVLAPVIKRAAAKLGIAVEWGGDWKNWKDGPHWQLPWSEYPS